MMKRFMLILFGIGLMVILACKPGSKQPEFDITAEFSKLDTAHKDIVDVRTQISELDSKIATLEDAKANPRKYKKEDLPTEDLAELQTKRSEMKSQLDEKVNTFMDNLTMFLNKGLNDFPDAQETKKAVRMYSDENILIAEEYIQKGGKYTKAIDIYRQAIQFDPEYDVLLEKIKRADELKYITQERFDEVKAGMSMDQVKEICGVPNINFIKEYNEGGKTVIAWFYQREDASAAGFYFNRGRLYNKKWTAVKKEQ